MNCTPTLTAAQRTGTASLPSSFTLSCSRGISVPVQSLFNPAVINYSKLQARSSRFRHKPSDLHESSSLKGTSSGHTRCFCSSINSKQCKFGGGGNQHLISTAGRVKDQLQHKNSWPSMNFAGIISSSYNRHLSSKYSLKKLLSQISAHVSCNNFLSLPTQQVHTLNCSSVALATTAQG